MADKRGTWQVECGGVAVHSADQGGWAARYSRRYREGKADTTCLGIWVSPAQWYLFYLLLLLSHQNTPIPRLLLNPTIFQTAPSEGFLFSLYNLFHLQAKIQLPLPCKWVASSLQISASAGLPATQGGESASLQPPLASQTCGWSSQLPSSCPNPPQLPTTNATSHSLISQCGRD